MRSLSVIVLTYNSAADIEQCIRSVERLADLTITAVDNNSSDATVAILRRLYDEGALDKLICRNSNDGFARAINEAIRATPDHCDVLLLNPDATLESGSLDLLRTAAHRHSDAGILSPLVHSSQSVKTTTAGLQPRILPMFAHYTGLSRLCRSTRLFRGRYLYLDGLLQPVERVEWVAGACMYITRPTIDQIGLLSERWFMYAEDTEYCERARAHGFDVLLLRDARCFHAMGQSVKKSPSSSINVMWPRSLTDYYKTTFEPNLATFTVWRLVFSLGLLSRAAVFAVRARKKTDDNLQYEARRFARFARAVWKG
jgi:GT2 family glycosyltransferase